MKVVELESQSQSHREKWRDAAEYLREMADRFERGEILDAVLVYNDKQDKCFASWGNFEDRWRLLGALEYAKAGVHNH